MFRSVDDEIAEIYNKRFRKLGPTPEASMWFSKKDSSQGLMSYSIR